MTHQAAVALAVVTGPQGVLLIERQDGLPPVAFPRGKVEPDETVEQAAVRETDEETGHLVRAVSVLGQRIHPTTGTHIAYIAAELVTRSPPRRTTRLRSRLGSQYPMRCVSWAPRCSSRSVGTSSVSRLVLRQAARSEVRAPARLALA